MSLKNSKAARTAAGLLATALFAITAGCASHGQPESVAAVSEPADASTAMNAVADSSGTSAESGTTTESGTSAESGTSEAVTAEEQPKKTLICRRIKPTGSRMGERICMRPEQWEKYAGQSRKGLEDIQRKALTTNDQGG